MKYNNIAILAFLCLSFIFTERVSILNSKSNKAKKGKSPKNGKSPLTAPTKVTKVTPNGKGDLFKLADHDIDCKTGCLSRFTYKNVGPYKGHFEFNCVVPSDCNPECVKRLSVHDAKTCKFKHTTPNGIPKQHEHALSGLTTHPLHCDKDTLMTRIKMNLKKNPDKVFFNYTCCPMKVGPCKKFEGPWKNHQNLSTLALNNYPIGALKPEDVASHGIKSCKIEIDKAKKTFRWTGETCVIIG